MVFCPEGEAAAKRGPRIGLRRRTGSRGRPRGEPHSAIAQRNLAPPSTLGVESGAESFGGASLCFCRLFFAIPAGRGRFERAQKASRDFGYFIDSSQERGLVCLRRFVKAADFPHVLERRGSNLFVRNRWIEVEKGFDIPAHSP